MDTDPIIIAAATRTPIGNLLGTLSSIPAHQLGSIVCQTVLKQTQLAGELIDEILMGCVLPAGQGQAPARQAALNAGLPDSVSATTINKMCGSGMKAVMLAHDAILAGANDIILAGGMENMSQAPYLLNKARGGYRLGHGQLIDHMFLDGLEDAYDKGKLMGCFAEATAKKYGFSRTEQDKFAYASMQRTMQANQQLQHEITPVTVTHKKTQSIVAMDENPSPDKLTKIARLKPVFQQNGTVTPANSSSISDGAAVLLLMRRSQAEQHGLTPLATIHGHASHAQQPQWFTTAPSGAINKLLEKLRWTADSVDLYEINEAFAVVVLSAMHDLNLPYQKVNIHGGACALGHPIGASGARIIVTLINALRCHNLKRGVAALCIGGGEATAMGIELYD